MAIENGRLCSKVVPGRYLVWGTVAWRGQGSVRTILGSVPVSIIMMGFTLRSQPLSTTLHGQSTMN